MSTGSIEGASVKDPNRGQPKVADLPTNRTLLVAEVSPRISTATEPIEASSLTELVQKVQKIGSIELQVDLDDILLDSESGALLKKPNVEGTMTYGEDPGYVMNDFDSAALVAKVQSGPAEENELQRRPLLRQRLTSLLIEQLLDRIARDGTFRDRLSDPNQRSSLLSTIQQEIERIEPEVRRASDDRLLEGRGGVA